MISPNCGLEWKVEEEKMKELRELSKSKPDEPAWTFPFSKEEYLKTYYDDEYQYVGPILAGTFIHNYVLVEQNNPFAENIKVPIHISCGSEDKVVCVPMI